MALETAPAFQFYVKEWRSSRPVMRMTFAQRGMYLEMLLEQWENLDLPDSPDACAELIGGSVEEWRTNWDVLRRKFLRDEITGRIRNTRLEEVRKERRKFDKWSKANARKGGLARAASAKRDKDGTYHPAESPAGAPAETPGITSRESSVATPANPATASASASASARESTRTTPIIGKRRLDAAWDGPRGLYVMPKQHREFLERRGCPESVLLEWYSSIAERYAYGDRKAHEIGGDVFKFWSARYDEQWPATPAPKAETGPRTINAKDHHYALPPTGTEGR